jgi:hypothetical protein
MPTRGNSQPAGSPQDPNAPLKQLDDLRDRFRSISLNSIPIQAYLIQLTSDHEDQGVTGWPTDQATMYHSGGLPSPPDTARRLELHGIVDTARMPQFRTDCGKLQKLADRAGKIARACPTCSGTRPRNTGQQSRRRGVMVVAVVSDGMERRKVHYSKPSGKSGASIVRDEHSFLGIKPIYRSFALARWRRAMGIPANWLEHLPDCFVSELDDAAQASADLCDVLLAELDSIAAAQSPTLADTDAETNAAAIGPVDREWNDLTDRQRDCLQALYEAKALDADTSLTADEIATRAAGAKDPSGFKRPLSDLCQRGLIDSKTGRGGGSWITTEGRLLVESAHPGGQR